MSILLSNYYHCIVLQCMNITSLSACGFLSVCTVEVKLFGYGVVESHFFLSVNILLLLLTAAFPSRPCILLSQRFLQFSHYVLEEKQNFVTITVTIQHLPLRIGSNKENSQKFCKKQLFNFISK